LNYSESEIRISHHVMFSR